MDPGLTWAFFGVSMVFVLTPGADWAYAISSGVHRGVIPAVSGMLIGHLTVTLVVAAGVATVLATSDIAMNVLTLAGATYLIWLGFGAIRQPAPNMTDGEPAPSGTGGMLAKGVGISLLNPKVFLLFLALLPQFTSEAVAWSTPAQMVVLGAIHVVNCGIVYFAVGFGVGKILIPRPRAAKVVSITSGVVMLGLGTALVIEQLI